MEKKRPQLNLDELHQLRWLLGGLLALFSVWSVSFLAVETWALLLAATAIVTAMTVWPALPARVPRWVHHAAFPVVLAVFVYDLWREGQLLPAMVRLGLLLILYRTIGYRRRREDLQLIVLGLFLLVVTGVLTVSLAFAGQILAFTACALALLLTITVSEAARPGATVGDEVPAVAPAWTHGEWRRLFARLRAVTDWRLVVLAGGLFVGVVGLSGLLFLAIPRFQLENSLFLERFITKKSKTGFSDSIRFGDVTDILSDTSVALSVDVSEAGAVPTVPYLRMVVLDEYRDGTFRLSPELRQTFGRERTTVELRGGTASPGGEPVYWTFYFEPGVSRYLPLPGSFEVLRFRERQNVAMSPELRVVALRNEPATMTAFRLEGVVAAPVLRDAAFARVLREVPRDEQGRIERSQRAQLALPGSAADEAALQRAVAEITVGMGAFSPEAFALRASAWLAARHGYSLRSSIPAGPGDPLVRWMESRQPGHCELFAGAFAVLARTAGLPARVISGFKGGTWNGFSNNLTVRNSDAHAWCEVWDEAAGGWLRVDPTPGATVIGTGGEAGAEVALEDRLDRSWSARLDSLRIFWYRRIVNFDQRTQLDTLRSVKEATEERGRWIRASLEETLLSLKVWMTSPWNWQRVGTAAVVALATAAAIFGFRAMWRTGRWRLWLRSRGRRDEAVRREAGKWLRRLHATVPSEDHAAALGALRRLRYGARETWPEPAGVFGAARRAWTQSRRVSANR